MSEGSGKMYVVIDRWEAEKKLKLKSEDGGDVKLPFLGRQIKGGSVYVSLGDKVIEIPPGVKFTYEE